MYVNKYKLIYHGVLNYVVLIRRDTRLVSKITRVYQLGPDKGLMRVLRSNT